MSKKVYIPIVIAVLAAVVIGLFAVDAVAAKGNGGLLDRLRQRRGSLGQVTEVKTNEFTIEKRDGSEVSYHVNDETKFTDRDRNELTFADVTEGAWVLVAASEAQGQKPDARIVVILPEDFDPENMAGYRGTIAGVNVDEGEFTLKTRDEQEVTFSVDAETLFNGEAPDLESLEDGMWAGVSAETQDDGSLLAKGVCSSYPMARKVGQVTAVDQAAGTFTVKGRDGIEATFAVTEETRIRIGRGNPGQGQNDETYDLADLEEGMIAGVMGVNDPASATPVAKLVIARQREDLPSFDARFAGRVTAVDNNSFTIQTRDGETITFQVTGDTHFRSRGVEVASLDDLTEGMIVMVGAKELGNGDYQAQLVLAGQRQTR